MKAFARHRSMKGRLTVLEEDRYDLRDKNGVILVTILVRPICSWFLCLVGRRGVAIANPSPDHMESSRRVFCKRCTDVEFCVIGMRYVV